MTYVTGGAVQSMEEGTQQVQGAEGLWERKSERESKQRVGESAG